MRDKEKQVRVTVTTDKYDSTEKLLAEVPGCDEPENPGTKYDTIEYSTEARYSRAGGKVNITYDDSDLFEGEKTGVSLKYDLSAPETVTMVRDGSVNTTMIFEPGKRHISVYNTAIMPFELCIHTYKVTNLIERNGTLEIDYVTEIHGVKAERTKLKICVFGLERRA